MPSSPFQDGGSHGNGSHLPSFAVLALLAVAVLGAGRIIRSPAAPMRPLPLVLLLERPG
jgi:hypothetical protein